MAEFDKDKVDDFLGTIRKYMQVRGQLSQKDLAEKAEVGVSTMSRFLSQKTNELNPQFIAKIVAILDIPLHEVIDFVEEEFTDRFIRLVKFFKHEAGAETLSEEDREGAGAMPRRRADDFEEDITESLGTAKQSTNARVNISGKTRDIPFRADDGARNSEMSIKDKLQSLSPRQKAYMTDFLNLDMEGRDLIVDLGNNLFRYFKQKGMDF
jgi:transcriptional regulator with XRE-family HTH domain